VQGSQSSPESQGLTPFRTRCLRCRRELRQVSSSSSIPSATPTIPRYPSPRMPAATSTAVFRSPSEDCHRLSNAVLIPPPTAPVHLRKSLYGLAEQVRRYCRDGEPNPPTEGRSRSPQNESVRAEVPTHRSIERALTRRLFAIFVRLLVRLAHREVHVFSRLPVLGRRHLDFIPWRHAIVLQAVGAGPPTSQEKTGPSAESGPATRRRRHTTDAEAGLSR